MRKTKAQLIRELEAAKSLLATYVAKDTEAVCQPSTLYKNLAKAVDLRGLEQEHFWAMFMNARQQVLGVTLCAKGSVAAVDVHPRDVFREAIRLNAHSLILAHNHPSGHISPSQADDELTSRICEAGVLLGIPVLDHLVVDGLGNFYSYAMHGKI